MRPLLIGALFLACSLLAGSRAIADQLYWNSGNAIHRTDLAGGDVQDLTQTNQTNGIALDPTGNRMFWTGELLTVPPGYTGVIRMSALDGSGGIAVLPNIPTPIGIALDVPHGKMYWTAADNAVRRANLDGTLVEQLIKEVSIAQLSGIALDLVNDRLYFSYVNPLIDSVVPGGIASANLDGSGFQAVVNGLVNPQGVALDVAGGHLYWADGAQIQSADFAGQNLKNLVTGLSQPFGVALDLSDRNIFWTDPSSGKIQTAPFAGGAASDVLSMLANPTAIAILSVPILGDANGDGSVDFTDLGILLNNYDQPGTFASGDFNNSGTVDFTDLGILLNNYNQPVPELATAAPVPEPSSLLLGCVCAIGLVVALRRKCARGLEVGRVACCR